MKIRSLLYFTLTFLTISACNKNKHLSAAANKKLQKLLDQKEYFKLETQLKDYVDSLGDEQKLYYQSFLDNVFNRNTACIDDVTRLLKNYPDQIPDSVKTVLYQIQGDSYFKIGEYAKAAQVDSNVLKHYTHALSKDNVDDIKNDLLIRSALKNTAPQQTIIKANSTFAWVRDKLGLIEIPIKVNAINYNAIFDTRANISTITKTYAAKLGVHILNVSYDESSGATGIKFKSGMGIADSLYIGGILVKNVVFQVMPDSILNVAKFQLNIIIGFPVIAQLQEVHIYKNGTMSVPRNPVQSSLHNFALDGLDPIVALKTGNDTLDFRFDSGASSSDLYAAYYQKYKANILKTGTKKHIQFGGAGGSMKRDVYILPKLDLTLGGKTVIVDSVDVLMQKITPDENFYGNIGQDFTSKFNELIYNFKYMYIKGI